MMDAPALSGVYHFAGDEETTWADFAAAIFKTAGMNVAVEEPDAVLAPAKRPNYSVMDTRRFEETFGFAAPSCGRPSRRHRRTWRAKGRESS
ncbi:MAG: sugar nucleotide-binding protein [Parvularculaceae bacterium]